MSIDMVLSLTGFHFRTIFEKVDFITSPKKTVMFLKLAHTRLDVYKHSYELTLEAYKFTKLLPDSEKFNLVSQIRRAALSVHLNIAEGSSRKSINERNRFYEVSRGSIIE